MGGDSSSGVVVRPYERLDRHDCARLFEVVQRAVFAGDDPALYARGRFEASTEGEAIWVAVTDDRIVGFASLWPAPPFVHHLLVDQGHRGRGIGPALLRTMLAGVEGPVDLKCRLGNWPARRFYERHGWAAIEQSETAAIPYVRYRLLRPAALAVRVERPRALGA